MHAALLHLAIEPAENPILLLRFNFLFTLLLSLACVSDTPAQNRDADFERFKREMMPQVGKKITVEGVVKLGKLD